jgi:hypothetical protein
MTEAIGAAMVATGFLSGLVVGWWVRGWFASDAAMRMIAEHEEAEHRLRARLVDCETRLDAVTAHTMQRRQARAEASRKGWQTKRGKAQLAEHKSGIEEGGEG